MRLKDSMFSDMGLALSTRVRTCLFNEGIFTIEQLVDKTEGELLRLPNMGVKSVEEIKIALAKYPPASHQT